MLESGINTSTKSLSVKIYVKTKQVKNVNEHDKSKDQIIFQINK